ncbi:MAG: UDP-N-acetylglucosamine 2-epimerase (hydrolyzing) [Alphaproteobacteria bacterium]|nr:UDP-N-acetylglucosamine 2-epimerase (hydrolyzing) [Alphaproteobacteria bacterium]
MTQSRRICVVTGSRAEYGLLSGLLRRLKADPAIELQVLATAMHLNPDFGLTYREIENDGFIPIKVALPVDGGDHLQTAQALGEGTSAIAEALNRLKPQLVVVLGDRVELLAVSSACLLLRIPIAHIHGGEITEGAVDDAIRHAVTKMAHLHFPAAESYRRRIVQMGEPEDHVFATGALGIDNINDMQPIEQHRLKDELDFAWQHPLILATYHPETATAVSSEAGCAALLTALDAFPEAFIALTKANADPGGRTINLMIEDWVSRNGKRAKLFASLGAHRYLSLLRHADVMVGNSSSGIIEAPALGVPAVNIGDRQTGRLKATSIIDCATDGDAIADAIRLAMSTDFRNRAKEAIPPYGKGGAAEKIHAVLKSWSLEELSRKRFVDLQNWGPDHVASP